MFIADRSADKNVRFHIIKISLKKEKQKKAKKKLKTCCKLLRAFESSMFSSAQPTEFVIIDLVSFWDHLPLEKPNTDPFALCQ